MQKSFKITTIDMRENKDISAAKNKLKKHLSNIKDSHFIPTESVSWYWWRVLNKATFKNKLPLPTNILVRKLNGAWGRCDTSRTSKREICIISISSDIDSRKMFIATLFHEILHQWQFYYGNSGLHHGNDFKYWKQKIKKEFNIIV